MVTKSNPKEQSLSEGVDTLRQKTNKEDALAIPNDLRIGVYVCHCGKNIGGTVRCEEVAAYASELPGVVHAADSLYTCSEPGQEQIKNDIKELKLNRVVVASCTPRLHEPTFRAACDSAGLNPYLLEMANIREHCSWVHLHDKDAATEKAKDLVAMAVGRATRLAPQFELTVPVIRKAMVIGGGVAGIQAALDMADAGYKVYLVERTGSIGGRMAQIDKTFPTMDCSICILAPKMSEVGRHPNIELLTLSEVKEVHGHIGNFKVSVLKRARYVTKDCSACGECIQACPQLAADEFNAGLSIRRAIYIPFAQAVPSKYMIDMDLCLNNQGIVACDRCFQACLQKCIDFADKDELLELEVGTVVVATGVEVYDPTALTELGYGKFPNVITTLEFERLINAGGPSGGELIRPSDRERPHRVAFLQCIGSRSKRSNPYCSNVCCMNTVKDALLIKEHWPDTEIYVYYIDIRAFGKGFEMFFTDAGHTGELFDSLDRAVAVAALEAVGTGVEIEVLMDRDVGVRRQAVRHVTNDFARQLRLFADGVTVEEDVAGGGFLEGGDDPHGGGFAGSVWPHEPKDVADIKSERDVVDRDRGAELLAQVFDLDFHGWAPASGSGSSTP